MDTYTRGFIKSAGKSYKLSLLKQAKKDYTPLLWDKYTTSDLRQALSDALLKMTLKLDWRQMATMLRVFAGGLMMLAPGALAAAVTPTWDILRLKRLAKDKHYVTKALLIPGYDTYNALKIIGIQRAIQNRVLRLAKKSKALRKNKEDSKLKLKLKQQA